MERFQLCSEALIRARLWCTNLSSLVATTDRIGITVTSNLVSSAAALSKPSVKGLDLHPESNHDHSSLPWSERV